MGWPDPACHATATRFAAQLREAMAPYNSPTSHYINLEFKQNGKWVVENKVATNSKGVANIDINPYCANDTWCDGTYTYRLKVGTQYAILKLTYSEN